MISLSRDNSKVIHIRSEMNWLKSTKYLKAYPEFIQLRSIKSIPESEIQTIAEVKRKIDAKVRATKKYVIEDENWDHLNSMLPKSQDELPLRSMKDSYDAAVIPIGSNKKLQDKYTGVKGGVRVGRLLEDLDIFSVWIVLKHINNPLQKESEPFAYSVVTARVDSITFSIDNRPSVDSDIRISGHVSWTGTTSAEVRLKLEQMQNNHWKHLTKAFFIMISRNRNNNKSIPLNKLVPQGDEETKLYDEALLRVARRKQEESISLIKTPPNSEEQQIIHGLYLSSVDLKDPTLYKRVLPENSLWMEDTKLICYIFPHPEDRNLNKTLFGGYMMRITQELAWMVAMFHSKGRPDIILISNVLFRRPIYMGELLKLYSQVTYTHENYMQIITFCEVFIVETEESYISNMMSYTFRSPHPIKNVIPESYREALLLIEGRRQFLRWRA